MYDLIGDIHDHGDELIAQEVYTDADFIRLAEKAIPNFPKLHREFDAIKLDREVI
jgi:hypothetical protein